MQLCSNKWPCCVLRVVGAIALDVDCCWYNSAWRDVKAIVRGQMVARFVGAIERGTGLMPRRLESCEVCCGQPMVVKAQLESLVDALMKSSLPMNHSLKGELSVDLVRSWCLSLSFARKGSVDRGNVYRVLERRRETSTSSAEGKTVGAFWMHGKPSASLTVASRVAFVALCT